MNITPVYNVELLLMPELYRRPMLKITEPHLQQGLWIVMAHFPHRDKDEFITVTPFFCGPERAQLIAVTEDQYTAWKGQKLYALRAQVS